MSEEHEIERVGTFVLKETKDFYRCSCGRSFSTYREGGEARCPDEN